MSFIQTMERRPIVNESDENSKGKGAKMQKRLKRKILVIVMIVCICSTCIPVMALTEEPDLEPLMTEQTEPEAVYDQDDQADITEQPADPTDEEPAETEPAEFNPEEQGAPTMDDASKSQGAEEETASPDEQSEPVQEDMPEEEAPAEKEEQAEPEFETETEDISFNADKSDYLAYDPLYITKYADPSLVTLPDEISMETFYKLPTAAKGIATYNVRTQADFNVTEKNYIAGLTYEMPVYDVDPDGKYYVAIPNVNLFNDNFRAYDLQVAYNNDYAELIKGWKYRKGILYIPKAAVDKPKNKRAVKEGAAIAVQLNYAIGVDMDLSKSIPVQILSDRDEPKEKTVHTANIFDQDNLTVDTGITDRKESDVKVMLNGSLIPISRDAWTYHSGSGKIDIYVEPGIVSNINIVFARRTPAEKVKDRTVSVLKSTFCLEAYADDKVSRDQMKNIKTAQGEDIVLDIDLDKMFVGWRGYYNASYMHGASKDKKNSMLALTGWENSVYYLYGGYTTTAGIPEGGSADKKMGPTWAFSSYALAYNIGASDGDTTLDKDTNLTHWNSHEGQSETHKIYYWVQNVYADDLELSDQKWGGGGSNDVNGLGGTNNFAISLPKKRFITDFWGMENKEKRK